MRKIENEVVAAVGRADFSEALTGLEKLITLDRKRAWWALFRGAAQSPKDARDPLVALVGRAYMARRRGHLVGLADRALMEWLLLCILRRFVKPCALSEDEMNLLMKWLPARVCDEVRGLTQSTCIERP